MVCKLNRSVVVNARCLSQATTGVQRYTSELVRRWAQSVDIVRPENGIGGLTGHAWEQFRLPSKIGSQLLFSPSNTGPLTVKRQVVTIHDAAVFDWPQSCSRAFATWYRFLLPRLARIVQKVITISEFSKARISFWLQVPPENIVVVPNGVDGRFHPRATSRLNEVTAALGITSKRYLVSVSTLHPYKNHLRLLEAWERAQKALDRDLWLVIVGGQGIRRVFRRTDLARIPDRTVVAGHLPEELMPAVYAGAEACVQVSLYEGFGLPALEAMASGTPVVASNSTAFPEVVGDAALLANPDDVKAIAECIQRLVLDRRVSDELRRKGLERAKQFSWDRTARQTWDVLMLATTAEVS